jgi:hypothetical protein
MVERKSAIYSRRFEFERPSRLVPPIVFGDCRSRCRREVDIACRNYWGPLGDGCEGADHDVPHAKFVEGRDDRGGVELASSGRF